MGSNIVVFSYLIDAHARAVRWALHKRGLECDIIETVGYPSNQTASVYMSPTGKFSASVGPLGYVDPKKFCSDISKIGSVWNRRPDPYRLDLSAVHKHDIDASARESSAFIRSLHGAFFSIPRWVNSVEGQSIGSVKINELYAAVQAGLVIPETCMSNDPEQVREFVSHQHGKVVCKPFFQKSWVAKSKTYIQLATIISRSDLISDLAIQNSPSIFQSYIDKKYEIRVVVMGDSYKALRLNSQLINSARVDWRGDRIGETPVEECSLPDKVWKALQATFKSLKLVFGCVDLIVTPDDEYVFLEINEQGQFLWMEQKLPGFNILAEFCAFLSGVPVDEADYPTLSDYFRSKDHERLKGDMTIQAYRKLSLVHSEVE